MLRSLSETVVLPIAAAILALVMCHELIQMITEKNNMHDFDTSMFFRWIFKSAFAILIVSNLSLIHILSMKTGKLTAQALQAALKKYLQHRAKGPKLHHGKQSLKQLKAHGASPVSYTHLQDNEYIR